MHSGREIMSLSSNLAQDFNFFIFSLQATKPKKDKQKGKQKAPSTGKLIACKVFRRSFLKHHHLVVWYVFWALKGKASAKEAVTQFERLRYDEASNTSLVWCIPKTGRTHQIRVHLQWLGHPIANDPLYAKYTHSRFLFWVVSYIPGFIYTLLWHYCSPHTWQWWENQCRLRYGWGRRGRRRGQTQKDQRERRGNRVWTVPYEGHLSWSHGGGELSVAARTLLWMPAGPEVGLHNWAAQLGLRVTCVRDGENPLKSFN